MTQIILSALRCLPLPKASPSPWANTVLQESGEDSFFATCLLPVAPCFFHALTPHLLLEGYLDNREWSLVRHSPTFDYATKIFLGPETTMEFCKECLKRIHRFVKVVARIGSSSDPEFRDLLLKCPFLEEIRIRPAGTGKETHEDLIEGLETAALVMQKHPSALARASAAKSLLFQMLQGDPELTQKVLQKMVTSPPPGTENYFYNFFNIAKKNFLENGTTGNMHVFTLYLTVFTNFIFLARHCQQLGEAPPPQTNPLVGFGGSEKDWLDIFELLEVLCDSGDYKTRLSISQYCTLMKFLEAVGSLKNSFVPAQSRRFFWQCWKEHRDSVFVPVMEHAPIIQTKEELDDVLINWRRLYYCIDLDRFDITKCYFAMTSNFIPDHYWYDCSKSGASEVSARTEAERLTNEDFVEMFTSGKRKLLAHMPFKKMFKLWDLLQEDSTAAEDHQQQFEVINAIDRVKAKFEKAKEKMRKISVATADDLLDDASTNNNNNNNKNNIEIEADDDAGDSDAEVDEDDWTEEQRRKKYGGKVDLVERRKLKERIRSFIFRNCAMMYRYLAAKGGNEPEYHTPILFENEASFYKQLTKVLVAIPFFSSPGRVDSRGDEVNWRRFQELMIPFSESGLFKDNDENTAKYQKMEIKTLLDGKLLVRRCCEALEVGRFAGQLEADLELYSKSLEQAGMNDNDMDQLRSAVATSQLSDDNNVDDDSDAKKALMARLKRKEKIATVVQNFARDKQPRQISLFLINRTLKWMYRFDPTQEFDAEGRMTSRFMMASALERRWRTFVVG